MAGSDSTAASIVHMIDCVSHDKDLQNKIQQELDAA
jgi:cytochrome P450